MENTLEVRITDRTNKDFLTLVRLLDAELDEANRETHQLCNPYNQVDSVLAVVLVLVEGASVACGACREFNADTLELKRIFVKKEYRGRGLSKRIIAELESIAKVRGYSATILETGRHLHAAMALYIKSNYKVIPNYGPYKDIENSVCMKKTLIDK